MLAASAVWGGGGHSWPVGGAVGAEGAGTAGGAVGDVLRCCRPGGGLSVSGHVSSMARDAQQQVRDHQQQWNKV